jgi:glucose/arabinose dehydrogenase
MRYEDAAARRRPRTWLATALLGFVAACGGSGGGGGFTLAEPGAVQLVPVATGLTAPVYLTHAGDGSGRMFVLDQTGQIRVIDATGVLLPVPFLDITPMMVVLDPTFDERGLLGLAFHPDYENNGRFFVRYSAPRVGLPGEPCTGTSRGCDSAVVSEFAVLGDPVTSNVADPGSERVLLVVDKPQFNHNGGQIAFGPDGFLYVSLGDGGGANDGLNDSPPSHGPIGNGQNKDALLGKMLRIDVDATPPVGLEYAIPSTNPFVGTAGADEIYAFGFRNPYRFSFDDRAGGNGALYVADVGQNLTEELDVVVNGGNYGWVIREGDHCFDPLNPDVPPATCPTTGLGGEPLLDPVLVYPHSVGIAIVGGYVYRGSDIPGLEGHYVFGDFTASPFFAPEGKLFHTHASGDEAFVRKDFTFSPTPFPAVFVLGIGQDEDGELYVLTSTSAGPSGATGVVHRLSTSP